MLGLLALEGFLWLSERFRWFPFNEHKGWTVLICLATVGAALVLMFLWFLAALIFRRRFQFSILSLLVLVAVVALPCSWLATAKERASKQRQVVEWIEKTGGRVFYDYQLTPSDRTGYLYPGDWVRGGMPPGPPWLRKLLGDDLFVNVGYVALAGHEVRDAGLGRLEGLTQLRLLTLHNTEVSEAGLEHLEGLTQLRVLSLTQSTVNDAGLEHLKGLTKLRWLGLHATRVSDAGLQYIKGLTQLRMLLLGPPRLVTPGCNTSKG